MYTVNVKAMRNYGCEDCGKLWDKCSNRGLKTVSRFCYAQNSHEYGVKTELLRHLFYINGLLTLCFAKGAV